MTGASMVTTVASTAPALPLVPLADTQVPLVRSLRGTKTVAVMAVLAVRSTVVCPFDGLCTSRTRPEMLAMVPEAAGAKPAALVGPLAGVDTAVVLGEAVAAPVVVVVLATVVLVDVAAPAPQAAANSETAAKVPPTRAGRRATLGRLANFFISFLFSCSRVGIFQGTGYSLRRASMGANRAARDAG